MFVAHSGCPDPFWIKADLDLLSLSVIRCTRTCNEAGFLMLLACSLGLSCLSSNDMKQHILREANRSLVLRPFKWKTEWKPDWNWEEFRIWKYYWTESKQLWDLLRVFSELALHPTLIQHCVPPFYVMTSQNKFKFIIHWTKTNNTQKVSEPDNVVECIHCKHNWQASCCTIVFGSSKGKREEALTHALIFP